MQPLAWQSETCGLESISRGSRGVPSASLCGDAWQLSCSSCFLLLCDTMPFIIPPPQKKTCKIQCMGLGSSCVVSPACLACGWWLPLSMGRWRRQRWWQHPHHQGAYRRNLGKPLGIPGNLFPSQATNHFSSPHSTRGTWQDAAKRSITTILRPRGKAAKIRLLLATARK